jgi:hypothetical protein
METLRLVIGVRDMSHECLFLATKDAQDFKRGFLFESWHSLGVA